jgi:hypothetical protein
MGQMSGWGYIALTEKEYQALSRRQKMSSHESGSKGGSITRDRMGPDYYVGLGQRGGDTTAERHGSEFFKNLGKQGGTATRDRHSREHYVAMGKIGGARVREAFASLRARGEMD